MPFHPWPGVGKWCARASKCGKKSNGALRFSIGLTRHKKEPRAVHVPGASTGCCLSLWLFCSGGGASGDGCRPDGAFHEVLFTNNSTVNLTNINDCALTVSDWTKRREIHNPLGVLC
jgi:hypothetical protein